MTTTVRVVSAVLDKHNLTLYKEDGETIIIAQGDPRLRPLVDKVFSDIETQKYSDITDNDVSLGHYYKEAEESMNGFIKFFRAARQTIDDILGKFSEIQTPMEPRAIGEIPNAVEEEPVRNTCKSKAAVDEIMANAKPAHENSSPLAESETVVAVLGDGTVIPGVEKLETQLKSIAMKMGSAIGVENFFRRVATVQRQHSVQDLLTFMQKGELPIADDGSVLVYKLLKSTSEEGVFADVHTGKVKQRVGTHVFMDPKLVDHNRSQDCSNGLHVARRDYLRSFDGDVCVLAKLAPEDVIAVPHSDARKLRACGYHIIARLSNKDRDLVKDNKAITDTVLLGNAVKGNHIGIIEKVEITENRGGGLKVTKVSDEQAPALIEAHAESLDSIEDGKGAAPVDAGKVAVTAAKAKASGKSMRQVEVDDLYDTYRKATKGTQAKVDAAKAVIAFKKKCKVSWDKLGLSDAIGTELNRVVDAGVSVVPEAKTVKAFKPATKAKVPSVKVPTATAVKSVSTTGTPAQQIKELLAATKVADIDVGIATRINELRKKSKKSWIALGVKDAVVKKIEKLLK